MALFLRCNQHYFYALRNSVTLYLWDELYSHERSLYLNALNLSTAHWACRVRKLTDTLQECVTDPANRCDYAIAVNSSFYCRHPDRFTLFGDFTYFDDPS